MNNGQLRYFIMLPGLLLICILSGIACTSDTAGGSGFVICACNTEECVSQGTERCVASNMCFAQDFRVRNAGADSADTVESETRIVRGCINRSTPLLCENRPPATSAFARRMMANWPLLHCCSTDLCNQDVIPTLPPWFPANHSDDLADTTDTDSPADEEDAEPIEPKVPVPIRTRPRFRNRRPLLAPSTTTLPPSTVDYGQIIRSSLDESNVQDLVSYWSEVELETESEVIVALNTTQTIRVVVPVPTEASDDMSDTHANILYIVVPGVGLVGLLVALCLLVIAVRRAGMSIYGSIPVARPDLLKQSFSPKPTKPTLQVMSDGESGRVSGWSGVSSISGSHRFPDYNVAPKRERMLEQENPYSVWTVMQAKENTENVAAQDPYHYNRMALYGYRNAGAT